MIDWETYPMNFGEGKNKSMDCLEMPFCDKCQEQFSNGDVAYICKYADPIKVKDELQYTQSIFCKKCQLTKGFLCNYQQQHMVVEHQHIYIILHLIHKKPKLKKGDSD